MVHTRIENELGAGRVAVYRRLHVNPGRDGYRANTALGNRRATKREHRYHN
jgi:hypothetical protein